MHRFGLTELLFLRAVEGITIPPALSELSDKVFSQHDCKLYSAAASHTEDALGAPCYTNLELANKKIAVLPTSLYCLAAVTAALHVTLLSLSQSLYYHV